MSNKFNWKSFSGVFLALFFLFGAVIPEAGANTYLVWAKTYNLPPLQFNMPNCHALSAVATDNNGNVYVLGQASPLPPDKGRIALIKYSSRGQVIWDRMLSYAPCYLEQINNLAVGMAVDNQGNVYIAGVDSPTGWTGPVFAVKYDTNGHLLWQRTYAGNNIVRAITLDNNGNLFVAGMTDAGKEYSRSLTIKYGTNGEELWAKQRNRSLFNAIATDKDGNVYVTGNYYGENTGLDYLTVKYNVDGQEVWLKRFNGSEKDHDFASSLAVDGEGNVIVVGNSLKENELGYVAVKYSRDGERLWTRRFLKAYDPNLRIPIILDSKGDVYIAVDKWGDNPRQNNIALVKISSDGKQLWNRQYEDELGWSYVGAMIIDSQDNLYLSGSVEATKCITLKYNSEGKRLWKREYNPGAQVQWRPTIAMDGQQNIIIGTGMLGGNIGTTGSFLTLKYAQ